MNRDHELISDLKRLADHGHLAGAQLVLERAELQLRGQIALAAVGASRRRPHRWLIVATSALAVLVAVGIVPVLVGSESGPVADEVVPTILPQAPTVTLVTTTVPATTIVPVTTVRPLTWTRIDHPALGGPSGQEVSAVAFDGTRYVAVGSERDGEDQDAAVWFSTDGLDWERVPHDEGLFGGSGDERMSDVVVGGPGFVAVGSSWLDWTDVSNMADARTVALVWVSPDGVEWSRVEVAEPRSEASYFYAMQGVTVGGPGLIAVGWDFDSESFEGNAATWTSLDGSTWVRNPAGPELSRALMDDVIPYQGGYVAVGSGRGWLFYGSRGCSPSEQCPAAAWTSDDGSTWTRIESDAFSGRFAMVETVYVEAEAVAVSGTRIFATGFDRSAAIWTFDIERGWVRVPHTEPLFGGAFIHGVAADGDRVVAVGEIPNFSSVTEWGTFGEGSAAVWISLDGGFSWEQAPHETAFTEFTDTAATMLDVINVDGSLIAVGRVGDDGAVWIGTWNEN